MDAITGMQASLARKAQEMSSHRFGDLWSLLCREEWIRYALQHVLSNEGARTSGIDRVTRNSFENEETKTRFITELRDELRTCSYIPDPVKRIYIPKANGKLRPLGIPTIKDRTVQMLLKMILEPIWESDFLECSSGFRPGRRTTDCIEMVYKLTTSEKGKMYWAIEGDITGCFDNIQHAILMRLLEKRIGDRRILKLLEQFLTAGIMEGRLFQRTDAGTPQGGIVSPLLANIYLHELDRYWWEHYGNLTPYERQARRQRGHQGNNRLIRYADDFLLLTNGGRAEAERLKAEIGDFLHKELRLELSPEKTLITHINDGYNFLGFHIRRHTHPEKGTKPVVLITPSEEAQGRFKDKVRQLTAMNKIAAPLETIRVYNRLARGWANYYRFVNSKRIFGALDSWVYQRMLHWLARRHQVGLREVWRMYDGHHQTGRTPGSTRSNLGTTDEKGQMLYRFIMSDLKVERYLRKRIENPYLSQETGTTVSESDTPIADNLMIGDPSAHAEWQEQRLRKLAEVGYRCERCGTQEKLHVHHTKPAKGRDRGTINHPLEWLVVLCAMCHRQTHREQSG